MRRIALAGICSVILLALPIGVGAWAYPQGDAFQGSWTSIDISDGSHQTLDIRGSGRSGHHAMALFDDATSGACRPSPARVQGSGVVDGNRLQGMGTLTCRPGGNPLTGRIPLGFVYHPRTDTLTDDAGIRWHRA